MSGFARTNILTEREGFLINKASNYEKRSALKCCNCNTLHIPLYINGHFTLPSLCEASHNDGWGEGFEQRPRATGDGNLYVHFWQSEGFFLKTKQELERSLQKNRGESR